MQHLYEKGNVMKYKNQGKRDRLRKGIFILPNLFTSFNIFCGFYAIISTIDGKFVMGAVAIIVAAVFDILDGKIARATNTTSKFGIEFDSLADVISFGVAPALLMYTWMLRPFGRIGWLAAFLFMVCGALRLARFNTQTGTISSDYFVGLPIPAAAGFAATTLLFHNRLGVLNAPQSILVLALIYLLSFLMVSNIKYYSFKRPELFKRGNFNLLVATILIMIFIASQPPVALFFMGLIYVVSGPVHHLWRVKTAQTREHDLAKDSEKL